jgi:hypothetical protein
MILIQILKTVVLLITLSCLAGCHSFEQVNVQGETGSNGIMNYHVEPNLYPGDEVNYILLNGSEGNMKIRNIDGSEIFTTDRRVFLLNNMASMKKKEISSIKTMALIAVGGYCVFTITTAVLLINSINII